MEDVQRTVANRIKTFRKRLACLRLNWRLNAMSAKA